MISYSVKGNFADAYEVNRHVNSGAYYFKPKKGTNIISTVINDIMDVKCDDPEFEIRIYRGDIIFRPYDPNLVPGCDVECHFEDDMKLEIRVEFVRYSEISGDKMYNLYLNISKI